MNSVTLKVEGMHCDGCEPSNVQEQQIKDALGRASYRRSGSLGSGDGY